MYIGRFLLETAHGEGPLFWFKAPGNPVQFSSVPGSWDFASNNEEMEKARNRWYEDIQPFFPLW